jgi:hypothetical protein
LQPFSAAGSGRGAPLEVKFDLFVSEGVDYLASDDGFTMEFAQSAPQAESFMKTLKVEAVSREPKQP